MPISATPTSESERDTGWLRSLMHPVAVALIVGAGSAYLTAHTTVAVMLRDVENNTAAIEMLAERIEERPTTEDMAASEDRSRSYTDTRFDEIRVRLEALTTSSDHVKEALGGVTQDLRELRRMIREIERDRWTQNPSLSSD